MPRSEGPEECSQSWIYPFKSHTQLFAIIGEAPSRLHTPKLVERKSHDEVLKPSWLVLKVQCVDAAMFQGSQFIHSLGFILLQSIIDPLATLVTVASIKAWFEALNCTDVTVVMSKTVVDWDLSTSAAVRERTGKMPFGALELLLEDGAMSNGSIIAS